jgi:hypothetical protein
MSFLSAMLPTIAGAGLMAASGGAINPLTAGLIMGGLQTARTGSVQKGLMAGLGAYGGAGLAGGLVGAGAQQVAGEQLAKEAATNAAAEGISLPSNYAELAGRTATPAQLEAAKAGMSGFDAASKGLGAIQSGGFGAYQSGMQAMGGPSMMRAGLAATAPMMTTTTQQPQIPVGDNTMPQRMQYNQGTATPFPQPNVRNYNDLNQDFGYQQSYFPNAGYQQITPEQARSIRGYAGGGPVEAMSQANAVGMNTGYPQADVTGHAYATPWQTPVSQNVVQGTADTGVNRMTGQMLADGGVADEHYNLGGYSDGGRLLRGPGDGVSDSIPAVIGKKKPARLADGEFVVPARIVSELGNGSTEAGARKLYAMLDRVQSARKKSIGKGKVANNSRADKYLPA